MMLVVFPLISCLSLTPLTSMAPLAPWVLEQEAGSWRTLVWSNQHPAVVESQTLLLAWEDSLSFPRFLRCPHLWDKQNSSSL